MNLLRTIVVACLISACGKNKPVEQKAEAMSSVKKITGEEVVYSADNIQMKGYLAYDANQSGKRPGILVVHEWWGHNAYARKRADLLAEMGYIALAVDMYGDGKQAAHPGDAGKFAGEVMKNAEGAKARFMKAMETLQANPNCDAANIAAIGYCFGGSVVLDMARQSVDLKAVASFHGGLSTSMPAKPGSVKAQILVCNGGADKMIPQPQIDAFKKEMMEAKAVFTFKSYEGALHGFSNPGADSLGKKFNIPIGYNAAADEQSWAEMTEFFKAVFAK